MDKSFYLQYVRNAITRLDEQVGTFEGRNFLGAKEIIEMMMRVRAELIAEQSEAVLLPDDTDWVARFREKLTPLPGKHGPRFSL